MSAFLVCAIGWIILFVSFLFGRLRINGNYFLTLGVFAAAFIVLFIWFMVRLVRPSRRARQAAAGRAAAPSRGQTSAAPDDSGTITFRAAGTTFDNDDGTSRQEILRGLKFGEAPWADDPDDLIGAIEETQYNGSLAYEVLVNGYQVGMVPQSLVSKVRQAKAHVATCCVSSVRILGGGTGDDGRPLSYGCEITLDF